MMIALLVVMVVIIATFFSSSLNDKEAEKRKNNSNPTSDNNRETTPDDGTDGVPDPPYQEVPDMNDQPGSTLTEQFDFIQYAFSTNSEYQVSYHMSERVREKIVPMLTGPSYMSDYPFKVLKPSVTVSCDRNASNHLITSLRGSHENNIFLAHLSGGGYRPLQGVNLALLKSAYKANDENQYFPQTPDSRFTVQTGEFRDYLVASFKRLCEEKYSFLDVRLHYSMSRGHTLPTEDRYSEHTYLRNQHEFDFFMHVVSTLPRSLDVKYTGAQLVNLVEQIAYHPWLRYVITDEYLIPHDIVVPSIDRLLECYQFMTVRAHKILGVVYPVTLFKSLPDSNFRLDTQLYFGDVERIDSAKYVAARLLVRGLIEPYAEGRDIEELLSVTRLIHREDLQLLEEDLTHVLNSDLERDQQLVNQVVLLIVLYLKSKQLQNFNPTRVVVSERTGDKLASTLYITPAFLQYCVLCALLSSGYYGFPIVDGQRRVRSLRDDQTTSILLGGTINKYINGKIDVVRSSASIWNINYTTNLK